MRRLHCAALGAALFISGCVTGVDADREQIARSLSRMDASVSMELRSERMDLVKELGISAYDEENPPPMPGEEAPDFSLLPLRFYEFQMQSGITRENAGSLFQPVKLSNFRGMPVVLIFGSYT